MDLPRRPHESAKRPLRELWEYILRSIWGSTFGGLCGVVKVPGRLMAYLWRLLGRLRTPKKTSKSFPKEPE